MDYLPKTSLLEGFDTADEPVRLGETDADGVEVGYIAPNGKAYSDLLEAEIVRCGSRWHEAFLDYCAGRGEMPDPDEYLERLVCPENRAEVRRAMFENEIMWARMRAAHDAPPLVRFEFPLPFEPRVPFGLCSRGYVENSAVVAVGVRSAPPAGSRS